MRIPKVAWADHKDKCQQVGRAAEEKVAELFRKAGCEVLRFDSEAKPRSLIERYPGLYPPDFLIRKNGKERMLVEVKSRYTPLHKAFRLYGLSPEQAISLEISKLTAYILWERAMRLPCYLFVLKGFPGPSEEIRYCRSWNLAYLPFRYPSRVMLLRRREKIPDQIRAVVFLDFSRDLKPLRDFGREFEGGIELGQA